MRYPNVGDRVRLGNTDTRVWVVRGITDRGDIIARGPRLDDITQAPVEAVRYLITDPRPCRAHGVHSCDEGECLVVAP
jgi:hypothetical protein